MKKKRRKHSSLMDSQRKNIILPSNTMKNGYQLYNTQVSPPITHTKACSPHLSACRCNISFICTVLCKLVGVQTCASCCVMLSSRWILPPLSQAWGKSKASLSFMFYYHGSASLLTQAASAGQCVRISKRWPGKDFCFQGDRIMFYWVPDSWYRVAAGGVCATVLYDPRLATHLVLSVFNVCVCIFSTCQHPPAYMTATFLSRSVMSVPIPLRTRFIFSGFFRAPFSWFFLSVLCSLLSRSFCFGGLT